MKDELAALLKNIKLVATDCDGVLTDGGLYYTDTGEAMKKFNVLDGMGFLLLQEAGIATAIITSDTHPMLKKRADKLHVGYLLTGTQNKLGALLGLCQEQNISMQDCMYIGDDVFDLAAMRAAGVGCAPGNAFPQVKAVADYITERGGGEGCFRELVYLILEARGKQQNIPEAKVDTEGGKGKG